MYSTLKKTISPAANERPRSFNIKRNVLLSFVYKGIGIAVSFLLVPITISYVNKTQYGIWIALSSVISWLSFFDIGLGNGLKNKLTEARVLGNTNQAKTYVSTTYALLGLIVVVLFGVFVFFNQFLSWDKILNTTGYNGDSLSAVAIIVVGLFCLQLVVQLINVVLISNHLAAKVAFINAIGQTATFIIIFILTRVTSGSMFKLVLALSGVPILVQLIFTIWYFNTTCKSAAPGLRFVDFGYTKQLLGIGGAFFIVQIGALLLMQTDNIIVTQLFGPAQLTTYNIAFKVFSLVVMAFSIIMVPFWAAYTDAYTRGDFKWIKNTMAKMYRILLLATIGSVALLLVSPFVYRYWIGKTISVPFMLSFSMCLYAIGYSAVMANCYFLNGTGKIRIQLYLYILATFINIPLAIVLGKVCGLAGVMFSNVIIYAIMGVVFHIQSRKIINKTATGIWNK